MTEIASCLKKEVIFMIKNKKTLLTVNTIVFFVIPCIFVEDKKYYTLFMAYS